ncbi:hypothetical protein CEXT_579821 [Caerostris extrusa]|uniref:Secreted protein n=1 Tax=Caerostris extrusa TaxID=172846 RepID=A0AAV4X0A2_CAEEX|nr:hypothetical protein CEXT_579821 [Caerostris extrusa]
MVLISTSLLASYMLGIKAAATGAGQKSQVTFSSRLFRQLRTTSSRARRRFSRPPCSPAPCTSRQSLAFILFHAKGSLTK